MKADALLLQIQTACRELKMAPTTFGRLAVNDGKLVSRLEQGGRVTLQTVERVHAFIVSRTSRTPADLAADIHDGTSIVHPEYSYRFYDNRQKFLMFVNTTSERQIVADRVIEEIAHTQPRPPALRLLDACMGDGTALVRILRGLHRRYTWLPFYVMGRDTNAENVRLALEKMPDRFQEHPATILVMTNMAYSEAPWLRPTETARMLWHNVALTGSTAGEFEEQIVELRSFLHQHWQSAKDPHDETPSGATPVALVVYRDDQRFALDSSIPRPGLMRADFDMIVAAQPYPARAPLDFKSRSVVVPLVQALAPNGRLLGVHSHGDDPGLDIVREIWPDENPFQTDRSTLMTAVKRDLGPTASSFQFHRLPDTRALFRYHLHAMPHENLTAEKILDVSTLFGIWNAAAYIAQIEDVRFTAAVTNQSYLEATRQALKRRGGLWFNDELYVISRRSTLG